VDHLVTEDDTPVDSMYSEKQMRLLTEPLYACWPGPGEGRKFIVCANVGLFYPIREQPVGVTRPATSSSPLRSGPSRNGSEPTD
jgi:hypothetical protein